LGESKTSFERYHLPNAIAWHPKNSYKCSHVSLRYMCIIRLSLSKVKNKDVDLEQIVRGFSSYNKYYCWPQNSKSNILEINLGQNIILQIVLNYKKSQIFGLIEIAFNQKNMWL